MAQPLARFALSRWSLRNRLIVATMALSAIAIIASDFAASTSLNRFLVNQVDTQLQSVAGGSLLRLDRAGIDPNSIDSSANPTGTTDEQPFKPVRPLGGVPTATTVTLLDLNGALVGQLGGDIDSVGGDNPFIGLTPAKVISYQAKPFTLYGNGKNPDIRAIARLLPSGVGTVVVSVSMQSVDGTLHKLHWLFFLISLIVLASIGVIGFLLIRLTLQPLTEVEETAQAIADGDLSARLPDVSEKTEVGRLTHSLNKMLSRIEESFAIRLESESKLRRFVADASHELRTPLTAIRGFAELHRQGAVVGEEKTKELVGRIEKESIRMSGLVEDLLLLARLDQTPELEKLPVDLDNVIKEAVASARAAGPDHPITIALDSEESFVLGDAARIHQAVANLLANARTHTDLGTAITVSTDHQENEIQVTVADQGDGLSPEDQARIFERFYRADPSRVRVRGEGSGLGLSIVAAVMEAHGGSVSVASGIGEGARFTLHFPIAE